MKLVARGRPRRIAIILLMLCVSLPLAYVGCDFLISKYTKLYEIEIASRVLSPDGNLVAQVSELHSGAVGSDGVFVNLLKASDKGPGDKDSIIFSSFYRGPIGPKWISNNELVLAVPTSKGSYASLIATEYNGVRIRCIDYDLSDPTAWKFEPFRPYRGEGLDDRLH